MAEVARDVHTTIDRYLDHLRAEWAAVREIAKTWSQLHQRERADFILDWPIVEDRLLELREYADAQLLTPSQQSRYDELLDLVAKNRPLLEVLLQE
jgi:hypothetical protein